MTPEPNLTARELDVKLVGGVAWTAGVKWATQLITWGSLVWLTHILSPADYGVGAMAGTIVGVSNVLAEFGVGTAVLHMPELSRKTLAQLHVFSCLLCTFVFLVASAASPWVASFYRTEHVSFFIATNVGLLLTGLQAVPMGLLSRDMDYRRLSLAEAVMVIVQSIVSVIAALLGWGYWSLLAGAFAGKTSAAFLVCYWKPVGFAWPRWKDIRAPVELGRQTAVGRVAWSLYSISDYVVVGRIFGESGTGVYQIAMNLASAPAEKISTLLMRTVTPLFANVQFDLALVRRYYLIMIELLTLIVMPVMLGLAFIAPQAVPAIFGAKWTEAIAPLRWLALFMILRTMATLTEQVLVSQRLTRFTMRMSIFNFVIMPVAFYWMARSQGTGGVAAAWLILSPLTIAPLAVILLRQIHLPFRQYFAALWPALSGSAAMCIVLFAVRRWLGTDAWPPNLALVILIAVGAAVYAGVIFGFFRQQVWRYVRFVLDLRKGKPAPAAAIS